MFIKKNINTAQYSLQRANTDILRLISESEQLRDDNDIDKQSYDDARFAVFSWLDEIILNSQISNEAISRYTLLQAKYYQTNNAGELFFEKLNEIRPYQNDLREVYYICLALGFVGRYCKEGDAFILSQLNQSILEFLPNNEKNTIEMKELFPEAFIEVINSKNVQTPSRISPLMIGAFVSPVVLYFVLLTVYKFWLGNISDNIISGGL